jgi:hypothetical protein
VNLQISTASLVASDVHSKVTNNYQCTVKVCTGACSYSTYVHMIGSWKKGSISSIKVTLSHSTPPLPSLP